MDLIQGNDTAHFHLIVNDKGTISDSFRFSGTIQGVSLWLKSKEEEPFEIRIGSTVLTRHDFIISESSDDFGNKSGIIGSRIGIIPFEQCDLFQIKQSVHYVKRILLWLK